MKKYLIGFLAIILAILGVVGVRAYADSNVSPMILNIGPNGNVLMRGEVTAVGSKSLTVKSWGGSWDVNVLDTTQIISLNKVLSDITVGEFVGVLGSIVSDGSYEVDARIVREWGKKVDHDHDGISDDQDSDDDNDGVSDNSDRRPHDHDDDGVDDDVDSDDDDDGILDANERGRHGDYDNDGIRDSRDRDDDNDGIPDSSDSKPHDNDDDGKDDAEDEDDDGDGKDDDVDDDDDDNGVNDDEEDEDDDNSGSGN